MAEERGQAQIEAVAGAGLIALALAAGIASFEPISTALVIDGATHAGAVAGVRAPAGTDAEKAAIRAARRSLPMALRRKADVRANGGEVTVRVPVGARQVRVGSHAWSRMPGP